MTNGRHSRRGAAKILLGGILAAAGAAAAQQVWRFFRPASPPPIPPGSSAAAGPADRIPPGSGRAVILGPRTALLLRAADGSWRAFDATCSHAHCTVALRGNELVCPCHNGRYDLDGRVVSGPPPAPLDRLEVEVREGQVFVKKPAAVRG